MRADAAAAGVPGRRVALAVLLLGSFMGVLDVLVVTVAVPAIRADLGASFGQSQVVVAGYGLAYAVGLVTGGRLGDLFGRRRMFLTGMGGFVVASAACGLAGGPAVLIAARIVQGLVAATMIPQVLATIRATFPEGERGAAVGWYGAVVGLGAVCGPVVGGLLVGADLAGLGWRAVFLVNVPIGMVALAGAALTVPESRAARAARLDLLGVGLSAAGLAVLLAPLVYGAEAGWPPWTQAGLLAAALLLLSGFVVYEHRLGRTGEAPLLPLRLFTVRAFTGGLGAVLLLYATDALFFVLAYYLQGGLGLSAARAGLLLAPVGLGFAVGSAAAPHLVRRGGLQVVAGGIGLSIAALAGVAVVDAVVATADRPGWLLGVLLVMGLGHGLAVNPLFGLVVTSVADADAGAASGILLTTTQVANALGIAVAGGVFRALLEGAARGGHPGPAAYSSALTWTMVLLAGVTAAALPLLRLLRGAGRASGRAGLADHRHA